MLFDLTTYKPKLDKLEICSGEYHVFVRPLLNGEHEQLNEKHKGRALTNHWLLHSLVNEQGEQLFKSVEQIKALPLEVFEELVSKLLVLKESKTKKNSPLIESGNSDIAN